MTTNLMQSTLTTASVQRFGRNSTILRSRDPLSDDQIRAAAPSIFASEKHASRSARYAYIPTSDVLGGLRAEGFLPFSVQQGGTKDAERKGFTKHIIRMRHVTALDAGVGQTFREIVLLNSHDGTSSYRLMAGIFRLVCTNGMIVSDGLMDEVRVKHTGDVKAAVIDGCITILGRMPEVTESVRQMSDVTLEEAERQAFGRAALRLRYDDPAETPITSAALMTPKRSADAAPTIWNALNIAQENLIRGGLHYRHSNTGGGIQHRRTREVRAIDESTRLNQALWTLAEEMRKIKTASV